MKKILFLLISALFISCINNKDTAWQDLQLKGKVKTCTMFSMDIKERFGEEEESNIELIAFLHFNKKGVYLEQTSYLNGQIWWQIKYKRDVFGNAKEINFYNADGELENREIPQKRLANGYIIASNIYDSDGALIGTNTYTYKEVSNPMEMIKMTRKDLEGNLVFQQTYEYDEKSNLSVMSGVLEDTAEYVVHYEYDAKGHKIKESRYSDTGELEGTTKWVYLSFDNHGNWLTGYSINENNVKTNLKREIVYYK